MKYCINCGTIFYHTEFNCCLFCRLDFKRDLYSHNEFIRCSQNRKIKQALPGKDKVSYQRNGLMKVGKVYLYLYDIIKDCDTAYVPFYRINPQPGGVI
jgi:hypothetical protein